MVGIVVIDVSNPRDRSDCSSHSISSSSSSSSGACVVVLVIVVVVGVSSNRFLIVVLIIVVNLSSAEIVLDQLFSPLDQLGW